MVWVGVLAALAFCLVAALACWLAGPALAALVDIPSLPRLLWLLPLGLLLWGLSLPLDYWSVPAGHVPDQLGQPHRAVRGPARPAARRRAPGGGCGGPGARLRHGLSGRDFGTTSMSCRPPSGPPYAGRGPPPCAGSPSSTGATRSMPAPPCSCSWARRSCRRSSRPSCSGRLWPGCSISARGPSPCRCACSACRPARSSWASIQHLEDRAAIYRLFMRTTLYFVLMGLVGMAPLLVAGPAIYALVFGEAWRTAGAERGNPYSGLFLLRFVLLPVSQTLNIFARQDLHLLSAVIGCLALGASFALGSWLQICRCRPWASTAPPPRQPICSISPSPGGSCDRAGTDPFYRIS